MDINWLWLLSLLWENNGGARPDWSRYAIKDGKKGQFWHTCPMAMVMYESLNKFKKMGKTTFTKAYWDWSSASTERPFTRAWNIVLQWMTPQEENSNYPCKKILLDKMMMKIACAFQSLHTLMIIKWNLYRPKKDVGHEWGKIGILEQWKDGQQKIYFYLQTSFISK